MLISTNILMNALNFYSGKGYSPIDAPLLVDLDVSAYTKPVGVPELYHDRGKVYVASAEQSFLQLYKERQLPDGMYMAVTPCYRHERIVSATHYLMFMKLELIVVGVDVENANKVVSEVVNHAKEFFTSQKIDINIWGNPSDQVDLYSRDGEVEYGSYGYRLMPDGVTGYVYGTGCAFPRVSL